MDKNKHIFLSYSRVDEEFAFGLRDDLVELGFDIWMDQVHIPVGLPWDDVIDNALKSTKLLILIISPNSANSQIVKAEVLYAQKYNIPFLPIYYKETEIPFWWERHQFIILNEKNYKRNFPKLVDSIKLQLDESLSLTDAKDVIPKTLEDKGLGKNMIIFFALLSIVLGGYLWYLKNDLTTELDDESEIREKNNSSTTLSESDVLKSEYFIQKDLLETLPTNIVQDHNNCEKEKKVTTANKNFKKHVQKKFPAKESVLVQLQEPIPHSSVLKVSKIKKMQEEQKPAVLLPKKVMLESFDAPYDEDGVVKEFIQRLNNAEDILLQIEIHTNKIDNLDSADDKASNLESLFRKKGLKNSQFETEIINDGKGNISYKIIEETY